MGQLKIGKMSMMAITVLLIMSTLLIGITACSSPTPTATTPTTSASPTTTQAAMPTVEWDMTVNLTPTDKNHLPIRKWMVDEISKRTNGKFIIHIRYQGELGVPEVELPKMLKAGTLQSHFSPIALYLDLPWAGVGIVPFQIKNVQEGQAVATALRPLFTTWFKEAGYEYLPMDFFAQSGALWADKALPTIESMKGVKVRTSGAHMPKLAAEWGMQPTTVDPSELYLSMQRGVIDAAFAGYYWGLTVKMNEVSSHVNLWNSNYWQANWVINQDAWNKLPAEWQKMIKEDIAPEVVKRENAAQALEDQQTADECRKLGVVVVEPAAGDLVKAQADGLKIAQAWADKTGPKGQEALNALLNAVKAVRK